MPWVKFTKKFDFYLFPKYVLAYKAGKKYLVKQRCADEAIKAGKAELTERPEKKDAIRKS
jgi:hypothetical protein